MGGNAKLENFSTYTGSNALYVVFDGQQFFERDTQPFKIYRTVKNGLLVVINSINFDAGPISSIPHYELKKIVDSIEFSTAPTEKAVANESSGSSKSVSSAKSSSSNKSSWDKVIVKVLVSISMLTIVFIVKFVWNKIRKTPETTMPTEEDIRQDAADSLYSQSEAQMLETLEKLDKLHKSGIITEEEFHKKKTKILEKI